MTKPARDRSFDASTIVAATWLCAWLAWTGAGGEAVPAIRVAAGLALTVVLPGLAASMAVFPREDDANVIERLATSLLASVAIVAFTVLALDGSGAGLGRATMTVALGLVTTVVSAVAHARIVRVPADERFGLISPRGSGRFLAVVALGSTALLGAAWQVTTTFVPFEEATEFFVLSEDRRLAPRDAPMGGPANGGARRGDVRIALVSHEPGPMRFRIVVGTTPDPVLLDTPVLDPGDAWSVQVTLDDTAGSDGVPVTLYRGTERAPYRRIDVTADR